MSDHSKQRYISGLVLGHHFGSLQVNLLTVYSKVLWLGSESDASEEDVIFGGRVMVALATIMGDSKDVCDRPNWAQKV